MDTSLHNMTNTEFLEFSKVMLNKMAQGTNDGMAALIANHTSIITKHFKELVDTLHDAIQHNENELLGLRMLELHIEHGKFSPEAYVEISAIIRQARELKHKYAQDKLAALNVKS